MPGLPAWGADSLRDPRPWHSGRPLLARGVGTSTLSSRRRKRMDAESDSGLDLGTMATSSGEEGTRNTDFSGSPLREKAKGMRGKTGIAIANTQMGRRKRRKRRRRMATTSSPPPDQSQQKALCETAAEKNTDSSEYSSPLRRPKSLFVEKITSSGDLVHEYNSDPEAVDAYHKDFYKYQRKLAHLQQLPTLKNSKYARNLTDLHDLKQKDAIIDVARSVLSLSSSHDGKEIKHCSGIIIEWVKDNRPATIVTSSQIICTKTSLDDWEDNNVYTTDVKVTAQLLDGTTSDLKLLCFSKHYDIAFFEIMGGSDLQVASLKYELEFGQEACVVARDKELELICRRTTVRALDPCDHQKNHYLFIDGLIPESCTGGALTDFNRNGMVNALPNFAFIPTSLIIRCLRLWQNFKKLARPHLGLKLRTIEFMDISHLDQLSREFQIKSGLIVGKPSAGFQPGASGHHQGRTLSRPRNNCVFECAVASLVVAQTALFP